MIEDMNRLKDFIVEAKKQTYANALAEKAQSSRPGSCDYHFVARVGDGVMTYHDTYFGALRFIGEEAIYMDRETPVWGMNYYGETLNASLNEDLIDKILRPALMRVGEDEKVLPLRGPGRFEYEEYVYSFRTRGDLSSFEGTEEIYRGDELIFRLRCHGGLVK